jgi:sterol desaturase/sphingolipid hydroxylase (fatty acid hydroxylase superfamily)
MGELVLRTLLFAGLIGLAFGPLERLFGAHAPRPPGLPGGAKSDVAFATVGELLVRFALFFGVGTALSMLDLVALDRPLWGHLESTGIRRATNIVSGLLLFEMAGYAYHRLAHRVPALWRLHRVHHSAESMDWLATFRQHPLEIILMTLAQNAPLVLLGIPLGAHAAILLLLRVHTVFVHANLRVPQGWWSQIIATPRFHHRHHQRTGTPRNYAALFPFLDRLFRTHSSSSTDDFGLDAPAPRNFLGLMLLR